MCPNDDDHGMWNGIGNIDTTCPNIDVEACDSILFGSMDSGDSYDRINFSNYLVAHPNNHGRPVESSETRPGWD